MPKQWLHWNYLPLILLRGKPCQGSPVHTSQLFLRRPRISSCSWQNVRCLGSQVFKKKIKLSVFKNKLTNSRWQSRKKLFVLTSLESTRQDLEFCLSTAKQGSATELPKNLVSMRWNSCFFIDSSINAVPDNWWYSALWLKDSSSTAEVIWQIMSPLPSLWPLPCLKGSCRPTAVKGNPEVTVGMDML